MSTIISWPRLIVALSFFANFGVAQNCRTAGTAAWNPTLRNIVADCPGRFLSPSQTFVVDISKDGEVSVTGLSGEKEFKWRGPNIDPPAMLSWSPKSKAFFINDGQG